MICRPHCCTAAPARVCRPRRCTHRLPPVPYCHVTVPAALKRLAKRRYAQLLRPPSAARTPAPQGPPEQPQGVPGVTQQRPAARLAACVGPATWRTTAPMTAPLEQPLEQPLTPASYTSSCTAHMEEHFEEGEVVESSPLLAAATGEAPAAEQQQQQPEQAQARYPPGRAPGKKFYTDACAHTLPAWQKAAAMGSLLLFIGWIYVLGGLMLAALFSRTAALLAAAVWATTLLPVGHVQWRRFMANRLFGLWRTYFSFSIVYETQLDSSRHYLYADFPHGAFPLSQLLALTVRHMGGWDGDHFFGLAADSVFRIPLWRHVYSWLGIVPASAANLKRHLKWGSVGITPGGIAEMYLAGGPADHIYIRNRKGFVGVAVEEGVDIVPVYHFGNTQLLSFGPRFLEPYGRRWRFSLGLLYGLLGMPIPRRARLMMVVGSPVPVRRVPRSDPGFEAAVEETHAAYMHSLQALYNKHKGQYGWADHPLVMH